MRRHMFLLASMIFCCLRSDCVGILKGSRSCKSRGWPRSPSTKTPSTPLWPMSSYARTSASGSSGPCGGMGSAPPRHTVVGYVWSLDKPEDRVARASRGAGQSDMVRRLGPEVQTWAWRALGVRDRPDCSEVLLCERDICGVCGRRRTPRLSPIRTDDRCSGSPRCAGNS